MMAFLQAIWNYVGNFFNAWYWLRATGIVSYVLVSLSVISGLYMVYRKHQKREVGSFWVFLHQPVGNWGMFLGLFHGLSLFWDQYVPLKPAEILIPFTSSYHTIALGFGILALYGIAFTLLTTALRARIGQKLWRKFHMHAPLAYVMSTFHGLWMGTSKNTPASVAMYLASVTAVAILLILRFSDKGATVAAQKE